MSNQPKITKQDIRDSVKNFFDEIDQKGSKIAKFTLYKKLIEAVASDNEFHQSSLDKIRSNDLQSMNLKKMMRYNMERRRKSEMEQIYVNTPYAFEACRFDRMMNPRAWF